MTSLVFPKRTLARPSAATLTRPNPTGRRCAILDWKQANQIAHVAAARAHAALGVDLRAPRVDVAGAISRADVDLMWRPMPRIFGLYFNEPGANIGILVNSGLPLGARRHTAAHELGHHWLEHTTSVDDGSTISIGAGVVDFLPTKTQPRRWTDQEKCAEAFAAWFLMPRRVVQTALNVLGRERPETATDAYRLSVLLGTSFATTLRHLPLLKGASTRDCADWSRVPPGRLKARLDRGASKPDDRRHDVLAVDQKVAAAGLHVESGDRLVLPGVRSGDVEAPEWLALVGETRHGEFEDGPVLEVVDLAEPRSGTLGVTAGGGWTAAIDAGPQPAGRQTRAAP